MFNAEDKGVIADSVKTTGGKSIMDVFFDNIRKNLHIILSFSQIGETFKNCVKLYPSLVNCCSVDWYFEWPSEALDMISKQ